MGVAAAGDLVRLFAQSAGTLVLVGQGTADASNHWSITTAALANGNYVVSVTASGNGLPDQSLTIGSLVIDTVSPVITNVVLRPGKGQLWITFQDDHTGMYQPSLLSAANYHVSRFLSPFVPRNVKVTRVRTIAPVNPQSPQTVVLTLNHGRPITHARFRVTVSGSGITDRARNYLDGAFSGRFPTGNGHPPSNFDGRIDFNGHRVVPVRPLHPVAAKTFHANDLKHRLPGGPLIRSPVRDSQRIQITP